MVSRVSTYMPNLMKSWETGLCRKGYFGHRRIHGRSILRYEVHGLQYQGAGETAWHITVCEHPKTPNDYWVSGGSFYPVRISYESNNTTMIVSTNQPVVDLDPDENEAVMTAIAEWENPSQRQ
jgi:hypothetical protein